MNKKEQQKKESDIICQKQNFREMIQIKINIYRREQEQILQKTLKEFEQKQIQDINQSLSQEHQQKIEQQTNIYKKEYENKLHDDAQIIQRSIVECYSGQQTQRDKRMTDYMQKSFSDMNQWMFKPKHLENLSKEIDQLKVQVKELHFQNNQYRKILRESLQQVPQHLKDRQKKKIFEESIEKNVEDDLSLIQLHKEIKEIDLKEPPFEDEIEYQRCNSGDQILEWGDVIINEIEIMTQVKRKLRQDKEKLKLSSQQLKEYQTKFQKEKKKPQYKEEQIQSVKQNFNEQVDKINLIMEKLRKREILIKSKEQALLNLQLQYKKNSNPSLLQVFYKTYMSFKIKKSDNQKSEAQEEEEQSKNEQYPEKIQDEDDEEIYLLKQKNKQLDISGGSGDSHLFFDPTLYDKVFYNSDNNNESNDDDLPLEDQNDEQQTHDVADTHDNVPSVPKVFIEQKEIKQGFNYDPLDAFPKFNSIINFPQHQKEIFNRQKNQILQHQFKYNKLDGSLRRDQMSSAFQSQNQWFNKIKGQLNKHIYNNKSSNNSSNYGL